MSLPSTCPFTGVDGTLLAGQTTDFFGGTGGNTFLDLLGGGSTWQINANRAWGAGGGNSIVGYDAGTPNVVASMKVMAAGELSILVFRCNSTATQNLQAWAEATRIRVFDESLNLLGTFTGALVNGDVVTVQVNGNVFTVLLNGTACPGVTNITSSHGAANQFVAIRSAGSTLLRDFNVSAFVVATPTAVVSIPAPTGNTFAGTSGSSGTGPYTFHWQRSTAPGSGFANLTNGSGVSGATTLTMIDGSAAALAATTSATALYYRLKVTDSLAADFFSQVIASVPGTHPMLSLWIWDSIGAGFGTAGPGPNWTLFAPSIYGARAVDLSNLSEGGTSTTDWFNAAGSGAQGRLIAAADAALLAGQTMAEIRLTINDASNGHTATAVGNNLAGMAAYLLGRGLSPVVLHHPTGVSDTGIMATMLTYLPVIDSLCNATTIRRGDTRSFVFFSELAATYLQVDGVHQNDDGLVPLAILTALGTAEALGDAGGATGGVSGARIFNGF